MPYKPNACDSFGICSWDCLVFYLFYLLVLEDDHSNCWRLLFMIFILEPLHYLLHVGVHVPGISAWQAWRIHGRPRAWDDSFVESGSMDIIIALHTVSMIYIYIVRLSSCCFFQAQQICSMYKSRCWRVWHGNNPSPFISIHCFCWLHRLQASQTMQQRESVLSGMQISSEASWSLSTCWRTRDFIQAIAITRIQTLLTTSGGLQSSVLQRYHKQQDWLSIHIPACLAAALLAKAPHGPWWAGFMLLWPVSTSAKIGAEKKNSLLW